MPYVLRGLILVQIVCKGYQQTTPVSKDSSKLESWREIANQAYTLIFKSIKYLPAKAISLINFVNSLSQVQAKNGGSYLDTYCLITYLYSWKTYF